MELEDIRKYCSESVILRFLEVGRFGHLKNFRRRFSSRNSQNNFDGCLSSRELDVTRVADGDFSTFGEPFIKKGRNPGIPSSTRFDCCLRVIAGIKAVGEWWE